MRYENCSSCGRDAHAFIYDEDGIGWAVTAPPGRTIGPRDKWTCVPCLRHREGRLVLPELEDKQLDLL